jgi:hypothetical protein
VGSTWGSEGILVRWLPLLILVSPRWNGLCPPMLAPVLRSSRTPRPRLCSATDPGSGARSPASAGTGTAGGASRSATTQARRSASRAAGICMTLGVCGASLARYCIWCEAANVPAGPPAGGSGVCRSYRCCGLSRMVILTLPCRAISLMPSRWYRAWARRLTASTSRTRSWPFCAASPARARMRRVPVPWPW